MLRSVWLVVLLVTLTLPALLTATARRVAKFDQSLVSADEYQRRLERHEYWTLEAQLFNMGTSHLSNTSLPLPTKGNHVWELSDEMRAQWEEMQQVQNKHAPKQILNAPVYYSDHYAADQPQQIWLTYTTPLDMAVSWLTFSATQSSCVKYGTSPATLSQTTCGVVHQYIDPTPPLYIIRYMHSAVMTGLYSGLKYYYQVGDDVSNVWSEVMSFTTMGALPITLAVYGDLGNVNAQVPEPILKDIQNGVVQMILHVGDYGYNMDEGAGSNGDTFFQMMQPLISQVPYQGIMGNHEKANNFSAYINRFAAFNYTNTGQGNWWFSWTYRTLGATVTYIAVNTEIYYHDEYNEHIPQQFKWVQQTIQEARANGSDWIVVYGHRPMYCSNVDDIPDCTEDAQQLREGEDGEWGLEEAIWGADLYISAHEHSYERLYPVWKGDIDRQQNHTYIDPKYPVHIVSGAGGCREYWDYFDHVFYGGWSVVRSSTYGYGRLTAYNHTHLYWAQQLSEGAAGVDELWIIKTGQQFNSKDKLVKFA